MPEVWDPVRVPRIRRIGRPSYFRGASPSDPETPSIAWVEDPVPSFWRRPEVLMVLGVSVLLTILVQVAASWNAHPRLLALLTLALVAPTVLLGVPASMLLAWFGMVGLGFFFGR